ncbi:hypothetical protein [Nevskia sp.]|uniref:hypothetical protein n=1 Tax=Nevskia sp. TaxID=1929292 RepID=UPI0025D8E816|nr:hypothetical protein [Nevskia sp.]
MFEAHVESRVVESEWQTRCAEDGIPPRRFKVLPSPATLQVQGLAAADASSSFSCRPSPGNKNPARDASGCRRRNPARMTPVPD